MLAPGTRVDRYVIESRLGEGGMGVVYRARDERLDRAVALKVVRSADGPPSAEDTGRLLREARAASRLDHPNAVTVFDAGEFEGAPYVVMELVEGRSLRSLLSDPSVSMETRVRWLADVARALAAAHDRGIVHRDVKPDNVMIRKDGVVKVLDFGIARQISAPVVDPRAPTEGALGTLTAEGQALGTPAYMAPEQIRGEPLDGRADQFAWGVLAHEVLGGEVPWAPGDAFAQVASVLTAEPRPLAVEAPAAVTVAVRRALEKTPGARFSSMHELLAALEGGASPPAIPPPPRAPRVEAVRYQDDEVKEILGRALEIQLRERELDGHSRSVMIEAAREIGLDDRQVALAEEELARAAAERHDLGTRRRQRWFGFFRHAIAFAMVNLFLYVIVGWKLDRFVLFGWGIGLASHLAGVLFPKDKKRKRKERAKLRVREVEEGVVKLVAATQRVRVADPGAHDAAVATDRTQASKQPPVRGSR